MKRKTAAACAFALALLAAGCATMEPYRPPSDYATKSGVWLPETQEIEIGIQTAKALEEQYKLSGDAAMIFRADNAGQRVAAASDRPGMRYTFRVIEMKAVNAMSTSSGHVFISEKLMELADDDDELSFVLAHEVAHVAAYHVARAVQNAILRDLGMTIIFGDDARREAARRVAGLLTVTLEQGYSRQHEFEADHLAAIYARRAGYDPRGGIDFLKKMQELKDTSPGILAFLSTHPVDEGRIAQLERQIAAMPATPPPPQRPGQDHAALPPADIAPKAKFTWRPSEPQAGGYFEAKDASQPAPSDRIVAWRWYVNGTHYPANDNVRHWYARNWQDSPGEYVLRLEIETASGKTGTAEAKITVK